MDHLPLRACVHRVAGEALGGTSWSSVARNGVRLKSGQTLMWDSNAVALFSGEARQTHNRRGLASVGLPAWIGFELCAAPGRYVLPSFDEIWKISKGGEYCEITNGGWCVTDGAGNYGNSEGCALGNRIHPINSSCGSRAAPGRLHSTPLWASSHRVLSRRPISDSFECWLSRADVR